MDGERALGAADGDVHVEPEHELARQHPRELGDEGRVLRVVDQRSLGVGERVRAGAGEPRPAGEAGGERAASAVELVGRLGDRGADGRGGLDLRGEELGAHRDDTAELGATRAASGSRSSVSGWSSISSSSTPIVWSVTPSSSARQPSALRPSAMRGRYPRLPLAIDGNVRTVMRIVVFPGVLRPPERAALLGGVMARDGSGLRRARGATTCARAPGSWADGGAAGRAPRRRSTSAAAQCSTRG